MREELGDRGGLNYRDTVIWQKAMFVAREVYRLAPRLRREETYGMRSQITRASVSVPANIAEGWTRETVNDKMHFMAIAQGSLAETETLLTLCEDFNWFPKTETKRLRSHIDQLSRILSTMRRNQRHR